MAQAACHPGGEKRHYCQSDRTVSDRYGFSAPKGVGQTPLEKERIRQLARIGANLNQLARCANTWKSRAEAVEILTALTSLERVLLTKDTPLPLPESLHVYEVFSS